MRMHNREGEGYNTSGRLVDPLGGVYEHQLRTPSSAIKGQLLSLSKKVRIMRIYSMLMICVV